jgi:hypothetical protein
MHRRIGYFSMSHRDELPRSEPRRRLYLADPMKQVTVSTQTPRLFILDYLFGNLKVLHALSPGMVSYCERKQNVGRGLLVHVGRVEVH